MPNDQANAEEVQTELKVTSPAEWRKQAVPLAPEADTPTGFLVELPSGNVIKMRRSLDLPLLLRSGRIPNPLSGVVHKMIQAQDPRIGADEQVNPVMMEQLLDLLDSQMVKCFVEPKVSAPEPKRSDEDYEAWSERINQWEPEPGTLSVFDIDVDDKMYVFSIAQGAAADLASFREQQAANVASLQDGKGVVEPTKRTGGNRQQRRTAAKKAR